MQKYIFGHDGIHEYYIIAETVQLASRVASAKFPGQFHKPLFIEDYQGDDCPRVIFSPNNRVDRGERNILNDCLILAEIGVKYLLNERAKKLPLKYKKLFIGGDYD